MDEYKKLLKNYETLSAKNQRLLLFIVLDSLDELHAKIKVEKRVYAKRELQVQISTYEMIAQFFLKNNKDFERYGLNLKENLLRLGRERLSEWYGEDRSEN